MARHCEVCGRPIKTGWKYCYEHRNTRTEPLSYGLAPRIDRERHFRDEALLLIMLAIFIMIGGVLFMWFGGILGFFAGLLIIWGGTKVFKMGMQSAGDIQKNVIKGDLVVRQRRQEALEDAKADLGYTSSRSKPVTNFTNNLNRSLSGLFGAGHHPVRQRRTKQRPVRMGDYLEGF